MPAFPESFVPQSGETGDPVANRKKRLIDRVIEQLGQPGKPFSTGGSMAGVNLNPNPTTDATPQVTEQPSFAERYKSASEALGPLNLPPSQADQMQRQYEQTYVHPPTPTGRQTLMQAVSQLAPVAIGGLAGGLPGAAGAAGGIQQFNQQQLALKEQRRQEFQKAIEAQKTREYGLAERQLTQREADIRSIIADQQRQQAEADKARQAEEGDVVLAPGATVFSKKTGLPKYTAPEKPPPPRNIDPLSQEGIAARVDYETKKPPPPVPASLQPLSPGRFQQEKALREISGARAPTVSYVDLDPKAKARVDAVKEKVSTGEMTLQTGLSALGGVRGGLGGALTESLTNTRVLPPKVRDENTNIERAKNLLVPIHQLVADINNTSDLQEKLRKSYQLDNYVQSIGTQFARAKGERGVVTDRDVNRVLGLLPGWRSANFAPQFAEDNLKLVEDAFSRDQQALLGKYFTKVGTEGTTPETKVINGVTYEKAEGGWRKK